MFSAAWFAALGSILLLDLILSGDNAILIAMACKRLPDKQKLKAMIIGCMGAVIIRVLLTLFCYRIVRFYHTLQFYRRNSSIIYSS